MFLGDIITPELRPILWDAVIQTFQLVGFTLVIGGVIGLGLGALLYATRPTNLLANTVVYNLLNVAVNIVRPIPFIIFITAMAPLTKEVMGTRIGTEAAIFPMTVMAVFVIGRVVEQNLVAVDPGVVEAARAMGYKPAPHVADGGDPGRSCAACARVHVHLRRDRGHVRDGGIRRWRGVGRLRPAVRLSAIQLEAHRGGHRDADRVGATGSVAREPAGQARVASLTCGVTAGRTRSRPMGRAGNLSRR